MRKCDACAVLTALLIVGISFPVLAGDGSRIGFRIGFGVSGYPSDKDIVTAPYKAIDDSPDLFDSRTAMNYHFDRKFGTTVSGAVTWRVGRNIELEVGFGYTDLQMEIAQHFGRGQWDRLPDPPVYHPLGEALYDYPTQKGAEFGYMTFRPGLNLLLSSKSWFRPYIGVGVDVMRVKGSGHLDFAVPYVTQEGSQYYLNTRAERLDFEGSSTAFGLDLTSGIEFIITSAVSAEFGVSYLFQIDKALDDFGAMVKANPAAPVITEVQYYSSGINLSSVSCRLGLACHL
jgi:opacity protein-like surface antigen